MYSLFFGKEGFDMGNELTHIATPITRQSIRMTREFPWFFRGSIYVSNGLFYTDRQYNRFLMKARKIKLKEKK